MPFSFQLSHEFEEADENILLKYVDSAADIRRYVSFFHMGQRELWADAILVDDAFLCCPVSSNSSLQLPASSSSEIAPLCTGQFRLEAMKLIGLLHSAVTFLTEAKFDDTVYLCLSLYLCQLCIYICVHISDIVYMYMSNYLLSVIVCISFSSFVY